jgi:hypothetical protein
MEAIIFLLVSLSIVTYQSWGPKAHLMEALRMYLCNFQLEHMHQLNSASATPLMKFPGSISRQFAYFYSTTALESLLIAILRIYI